MNISVKAYFLTLRLSVSIFCVTKVLVVSATRSREFRSLSSHHCALLEASANRRHHGTSGQFFACGKNVLFPDAIPSNGQRKSGFRQ